MRLGISPIGWSNDDLPELDGDMPLDTCLAEARWDGYDGISSTTNFLGIGGIAADPRTVRTGANLVYSLIFCPTFEFESSDTPTAFAGITDAGNPDGTVGASHR